MNIYDLVIKNAQIADPENEKIFHGNLAVQNGKIASITSENISGKKEIDAKNCIVCPGFIDIHAHIDGNMSCGELSLVQGVTTTVGGNCGGGPTNLNKFFETQNKNGFLINQLQFIGHSFSLRHKVGIDNPYINATKTQIEEMKKLLEKEFVNGAVGLSFGLEYAPGSSFEEVIALSKLASQYKKLISIHTRLKAPDDLESLKEAVKISEITGALVQVSHLVYQYGEGVMTEALDILDKARKNGVNIWADSGMYTSFATGINTSVFDEDHIEKFGWKFSDLYIASGKLKGKCLTKKLYDKMRQNDEDAVIICYTGVEEEIYEALLKDYVVLSSDTGPSPTGDIGEGHPQNCGTFPRFFKKMVREKKYISLIDAIKKCTLIPANILGLKNKGRLSVGCDGDLVIFDMDTIEDKADFLGKGRPDAYPDGVHYVIVNGHVIVKYGKIKKDILPGRAIKMN
ncbi:N-acyl-D-amino-acid deacylase family protein [Clostridium ljungdahlii]|uniref:N-acyl-D-glutamate deacylase n=1 Tax=Clostridium ljungdahlii TaxID=1538 RepID=A0A162J9A7_9CLOT|nr:amidohydrolase family protein [Clostridium ljungdahlii]OAA92145.1 N-acyl-D-glutamate deacylase [Clostridium ljungdahlii]